MMTIQKNDEKICPKCRKERNAYEIECPYCGVIYEKAEKVIISKQKEKEKIEQQKIKLIEEKKLKKQNYESIITNYRENITKIKINIRYYIPLIILIFVFVLLYSSNYFVLQMPMNKVLKQDSRNKGIKVSVHLSKYINPKRLIYDLKEIGSENSMADVFRVLLQFAEKMESKEFQYVILSFRGKVKFYIKGNYFKHLGEEYSYQNPIYTMRIFPENLFLPNGHPAYPSLSGGWLGVMKKQMENFNDFHKEWFLDDLMGI